MSGKRPTLRGLIARRIGLVFTVSVMLFTILVGVVVDQQVHSQTDAMLLQLAQTEADGVLSEFEDGVHVHDTSLSLPSFNSPVVEKYSVAYGLDRRVQASTSNFKAGTLPKRWVQDLKAVGDTQVFDDQKTGPEPLRIAVFVAQTPGGERLVFATGVSHTVIDQAVRRAVLLIALLASLMLMAVLVGTNQVARKITCDIQKLSHNCVQLWDAPEQLESWLEAFAASEHATEETTTLARTVYELVTRLQRLVAVQSRFVAEASHELRTPLTALQGELELALRREREPAAYREFIENACIDAARLADLAEHLLEAARARADAVHLEAVLLKNTLHESVGRSARLLHDAGITIAFKTDDSTAFADPIATARVLDNLIMNVAKHSDALKVELSCQDGVVQVADDGKGLSSEAREHLFVPFAHRRGSGHGLGLFIASRLMEKQQGRLVLAGSTQGTVWRCVFRRKTDPGLM